MAALLEDRKDPIAIPWSRYLDKEMSKYQVQERNQDFAKGGA